LLTALTRGVSSRINECELSFIERRPIDFDEAVQQHRNYQRLLRELGASVVELPGQADCPDGCFIEDTALVLDELAILTRPRSQARRREVDGVASSIRKYRREVFQIDAPATLEGGDVLRIGRNLFVGLSERTNREGIQVLRQFVSADGYDVHAVETTGALHLKSVCTAVDEHTILAEPSRLDLQPFKKFEIIAVPPEEWMAANVLLVNGTVCIQSGFPKTQGLLERRGYQVRTVDISEFLRAEAGLTCLSLIFESAS
jgi:dimethylargininase